MALETSRITYDGVVKSFEVSSVSFVSSGNSLHIKAERRMATIKTLATLLLNWTVIPDTKRQQPVTSRLKSKHLVDTMSCQTPIIVYDVPRVVAVTENPFHREFGVRRTARQIIAASGSHYRPG